MVVRVVAGVLIRDGRVLAAKRAAGTREAGLWEFPGGKLEPGENDATALMRELREELGVTVLVGAHVGVSEHAYAHGTIRLTALACTLVDGEPAALDHAELRWLAPDALGEVEWAPADVPFLDAVRALLA
jgi:8-oxo-dGTP diphosphatase